MERSTFASEQWRAAVELGRRAHSGEFRLELAAVQAAIATARGARAARQELQADPSLWLAHLTAGMAAARQERAPHSQPEAGRLTFEG